MKKRAFSSGGSSSSSSSSNLHGGKKKFPIGWWYKDDSRTLFRFTPWVGVPLTLFAIMSVVLLKTDGAATGWFYTLIGYTVVILYHGVGTIIWMLNVGFKRTSGSTWIPLARIIDVWLACNVVANGSLYGSMGWQCGGDADNQQGLLGFMMDAYRWAYLILALPSVYTVIYQQQQQQQGRRRTTMRKRPLYWQYVQNRETGKWEAKDG